MSEEKQIYIDEAVEEMASAIREITTSCGKCEYYKDGSCLKPIDIGCGENEDILNECDALYSKGYRKAFEVAIEIFERLHSHLKYDGHTISVWENDLICIAKEYDVDLTKYTEAEE